MRNTNDKADNSKPPRVPSFLLRLLSLRLRLRIYLKHSLRARISKPLIEVFHIKHALPPVPIREIDRPLDDLRHPLSLLLEERFQVLRDRGPSLRLGADAPSRPTSAQLPGGVGVRDEVGGREGGWAEDGVGCGNGRGDACENGGVSDGGEVVSSFLRSAADDDLGVLVC